MSRGNPVNIEYENGTFGSRFFLMTLKKIDPIRGPKRLNHLHLM